MSYELVANSVTSGLSIALGEEFPGITRYREVIPAQMLVYPHFYIHQLTIDVQPERRNHYMVNYLVNIRYHAAADPSSITGRLQSELNDISIRMLSDLEYIYFDNELVRLTNRRTEKQDGVLFFFCNVSIFAKHPVILDPLQESLETIIR